MVDRGDVVRAGKVAIAGGVAFLAISCSGDRARTVEAIPPTSPPPGLPSQDVSTPPVVEVSAIRLLDKYLRLPTEFSTHQSAIKVLNDPQSNAEEYKKAVDAWEGDSPIFKHLNDPKAKIRFIRYLLESDDLDKTKYKAPDNGPGVDGDGVVELTITSKGTFNEQGEKVDTDDDFVCDDFSTEMVKRYGLDKRGKFSLPLFKAEVSKGYDLDPLAKGHVSGQGHAFNVVFLGSELHFSDLKNWFFFEPENDQLVPNPLKYLPGSRLLTIATPREGQDRAGESLISFFIMPDGSTEAVDDTTLQIVGKLQQWVEMNFVAGVNWPDEEKNDEPELKGFELSDIYEVAEFLARSRFLPPEYILGALQDSKLPDGFDFSKLDWARKKTIIEGKSPVSTLRPGAQRAEMKRRHRDTVRSLKRLSVV